MIHPSLTRPHSNIDSTNTSGVASNGYQPFMQSITTPQLLKYNLTRSKDGIQLCIWEPAPITPDRVKPFLFMARYRLVSEEEVRDILQSYQMAYQCL